MKYTYTIFLALLVVGTCCLAQTGPGGVSNSAGSLRLWLDSRRVNNDGSNPTVGATVSTWYDQSGNNIDVTQNTASVATYSANGVTFNNTGYLVGDDSSFPDGNDARTLFICASTPTTNADDVLFFYGTASDDDGYGVLKIMNTDGTNPDGVRNFFYNNDYNVGSAWNPLGTRKIITTTYTNNTQALYVNNGTASTRTPTNTPTTNVNASSLGVQVGGWSAFNLFSQATIAEVILHSALLDAADIIIINNYLAAKYGLTLTANDIYDEDNAGNGNFDYDVAGIGQSGGGSNNLDAYSSIVRVFGATGLGNGDYYIWGHDDGALTRTTSGIPGAATGITGRLTRIWRGSETNTITDFDLSVDLSNLGGATTLTCFLLIDTNNNGVFTDETVASGGIVAANSVTAGVAQFNNVTGLNNNIRFTFGTSNTTSTPLPVEFVSFEASPNRNGIQLSWATASELTNEYFEVERSRDGKNWIVVDQIQGAGTSSELKKYSITDSSPYSGINYYRVKQVDFDGAFKYSKTNAAQFSYYNVAFPNPTTGSVTVTSNAVVEVSEISVVNIFGHDVTHMIDVVKLSDNQYEIDMSSLAPGMYALRDKTNSTLIHKK